MAVVSTYKLVKVSHIFQGPLVDLYAFCCGLCPYSHAITKCLLISVS